MIRSAVSSIDLFVTSITLHLSLFIILSAYSNSCKTLSALAYFISLELLKNLFILCFLISINLIGSIVKPIILLLSISNSSSGNGTSGIIGIFKAFMPLFAKYIHIGVLDVLDKDRKSVV